MMSVWFRVWGWGQRLFHSIRVDAGSQKKTFLNVIQIYCNCEGREPRWGVLTPLSYDFFSFSAASMRRAPSIYIMADSFLFWQVLVHVGFLPLIVGLFFSAHHRWVVDDFHLGPPRMRCFCDFWMFVPVAFCCNKCVCHCCRSMPSTHEFRSLVSINQKYVVPALKQIANHLFLISFKFFWFVSISFDYDLFRSLFLFGCPCILSELHLDGVPFGVQHLAIAPGRVAIPRWLGWCPQTVLMLEPGKQVVATMVQPMLTGMRQVELQMQQQAPAWGAFWDAGNLPFQRQNGLERHSSLCTFRFCSFLCIVPVHVGGTPGDGEPAEQDMLPPISGGKTSVIYAYSLQFIKSSRSKPFVSSGWHANNLSFVPFGWLSMATTLFWSFLKEKNCLQRVPWTVRIWILTLVFSIAYAGASIITLTTCPNSLSPFSTFQRMADGTFWGHVVQIEPGDWKWTDTDSGRSFTRSLRTSFSLGWLEHCKCGTRFGPHFHEQSATRLKS